MLNNFLGVKMTKTKKNLPNFESNILTSIKEIGQASAVDIARRLYPGHDLRKKTSQVSVGLRRLEKKGYVTFLKKDGKRAVYTFTDKKLEQKHPEIPKPVSKQTEPSLQTKIYKSLRKQGEASASQISKELFGSSKKVSEVSTYLKRLEKRGVIEKEGKIGKKTLYRDKYSQKKEKKYPYVPKSEKQVLDAVNSTGETTPRELAEYINPDSTNIRNNTSKTYVILKRLENKGLIISKRKQGRTYYNVEKDHFSQVTHRTFSKISFPSSRHLPSIFLALALIFVIYYASFSSTGFLVSDLIGEKILMTISNEGNDFHYIIKNNHTLEIDNVEVYLEVDDIVSITDSGDAVVDGNTLRWDLPYLSKGEQYVFNFSSTGLDSSKLKIKGMSGDEVQRVSLPLKDFGENDYSYWSLGTSEEGWIKTIEISAAASIKQDIVVEDHDQPEETPVEETQPEETPVEETLEPEILPEEIGSAPVIDESEIMATSSEYSVGIYLDSDTEVNGNEILIGEINLIDSWEGTFSAAISYKTFSTSSRILIYAPEKLQVSINSVNMNLLKDIVIEEERTIIFANNETVLADTETPTLQPIENISEENEKQKAEIINDVAVIKKTKQYGAVLGRPVKWKKTVSLSKEKTISVEIPKHATNITIVDTKTGEEVEATIEGKTIEQHEQQIETSSQITARAIADQATAEIVIEDEEIPEDVSADLIIEETVEEIEIEYETPAPMAEETFLVGGEKEITIYSEYHYENVLAFTEIPDSEVVNAKLYHVVNGTRTQVSIEIVDYDQNGKYDSIEWVVPHLSNQTYELELTILNPLEFVDVGGNWTVFFETTGSSKLNITKDELAYEVLEFNSLKCGNNNITPTIDGPSIIVNNWSCDNQTASIDHTKVLPAGYFVQKFEFGEGEGAIVEYAADPPVPTLDGNCLACTGAGNYYCPNEPLYQCFTGETAQDECDGACGGPGTCVSAQTSCCNTTLPGDATLTSDLQNCMSDFILNITSDDVVLDCAGYTIRGNVSYGIYSSDLDNITIKNCKVDLNHSTSDYGMYLFNTNNSQINDTEIYTGNSYGFFLSGASSNNTIYRLNSTVGNNNAIFINGSSNETTFSYSNITASNTTVYLDDVNNITFNTCNIIANYDNATYMHSGVSNITMNYTNITAGRNYSVAMNYQVGNAGTITFESCNIEAGQNIAFYLGHDVDSILLYNNNITAIGNDAIRFFNKADTEGAEIINNTFTATSYAIIIENQVTDGESIDGLDGNNITNNIFNATPTYSMDDFDGANNWNTTNITGYRIMFDGPNSGGNAYLNSSGGYSVDCVDADNDGFCDSPLTFDTDNTDNLPLSDEYVECGWELTKSLTLGKNITGCTGTIFNITADNIVLDCQGHTLQTTSSIGIEVFSRDNVTINNCSILLNGTDTNLGIKYNTVDNSVINNTIVNVTNSSAIALIGQSKNNTIDNVNLIGEMTVFVVDAHGFNNTLNNSNVTAIGLSGMAVDIHEYTDNTTIQNSVITSTNVSVLIHSFSDNNTIDNCTIISQDEMGVHIRATSQFNTISDSIITVTDDYGIKFEDQSIHNSITGCNITTSGDYGIYLLEPAGNTNITNTIINSANYGLWTNTETINIIGSNITATSDYGVRINTNNVVFNSTNVTATNYGAYIDGNLITFDSSRVLATDYAVYVDEKDNSYFYDSRIETTDDNTVYIYGDSNNHYFNNTEIISGDQNAIYLKGYHDGSIIHTINNITFDYCDISSVGNYTSHITTYVGNEANGFINITNSNITSLDSYGMYVGYESDKIILNNSNITVSNSYGLYFDDQADTEGSYFTNNKIQATNYSIYVENQTIDEAIDGLDGNYFYNNLFNGTPTYYLMNLDGENFWNTTNQTGTRIYSPGSNIGGNFYLNATGGNSIDCIDADLDGFCDDPLEIDSESEGNFDKLVLSNYTKRCGMSLNNDYTMTENMSGCTGTVFHITNDNVDLNCDGYFIQSTGSYVISAVGINNLTISNCNILGNGTDTHSDYGVYLKTTTNTTLNNNTINVTDDRAVYFDNADNVTMNDTEIYCNRECVYMNSGDYYTVINNTIITANSVNAIYTDANSGHTTIDNSNITATGSTIEFVKGSQHGEIIDSNITSSTGDAFVMGSETVNITNCNIIGGDDGIVFDELTDGESSYIYNSTITSVDKDIQFIDAAEGFDFYINIINTSFDKDTVTFNDNSAAQVYTKWYVRAYVENKSSEAMESASVNATQNNGTVVVDTTTDANGFTEYFELIEFLQNNSHKITDDYLNYTFTADKTNFYYNFTEVNLTLTNSTTVNIILDDYQKPTVSGSAIVDDTVTNPENQIDLAAGTTQYIECNATIDDQNGADDIDHAEGVFYWKAGGETTSCGEDATNCYKNSSCVLYSTANPTQKDVVCGFEVYFNAQNTVDTGWTCNITANDVVDYWTAGGVEDATDINSLVAININTSNMNFGALDPGQNSSLSVNVSNHGNIQIDVRMNGTDLGCDRGSIDAEMLMYNCTGEVGIDFATGTNLTNTITTCSDFDLAESEETTSPSPTQNTTYWRMYAPFGDESQPIGGSCSGTVWFIGTSG